MNYIIRHKKHVVICLIIFFQLSVVHGQQLVLRPYWGHKWYSLNEKNIFINNFEPSFRGSVSESKYLTGIALELKAKNHSYEICYTSHPTLAKLAIDFEKPGWVGFEGNNSGRLFQFQFLYNYYFPNKIFTSKNFSASFRCTSGFGIGKVIDFNLKPLFFNDQIVINSFLSPSDSLKIEIESIKIHNYSYSAIFKAGVTLEKKGKEFLSINAIAHFTLNDFVLNKYDYLFTNKAYSGVVSNRVNYYGIQLSVPIKIFKF